MRRLVIIISCLLLSLWNVNTVQQQGCSFPSYLTKYSAEVWQDNDYHHARETSFLYGKVHRGRYGKATGVTRDSPDAWVTKVQHSSATQRWRSHKEITFTRDGSQMIIAHKQIVPCELQKDDNDVEELTYDDSLRQKKARRMAYNFIPKPLIMLSRDLENNGTDWPMPNVNSNTNSIGANKIKTSKVASKIRSSKEEETCYEVDLLYKRKCLNKIAPNKYLVLHTSGGVSYKTCLKFVPKSQAIVFVYEGSKDEEEAKACPENLLERDEWPWIAPYQPQLSFCPLIGGFDFKTEKLKEELCPDQWRPSRLEVECVRGEGMVVTFVHPTCSPFRDKRLSSHMICWGTWEENNFTFISASSTDDRDHSDDNFPRYIFRYQTNKGLSSMLWFFSPIAPINDNTRFTPVLQLRLNRSDSRACYDDSWHCEDHSRKGACSNSGMFQYANYCKRTCGLCNLIPPRVAECHFPHDVRKEWRLYESDHMETVTIGTDNITFSSLGTFLCKSKHWEQNYYKLFSYYENGCRLRYTCLHLVDKSENVLHFQISKSSIEDKSFEACERFEDDGPPMNSTFRSKLPKSLVASSNFKDSTCGLSGSLEVRLRDVEENNDEGKNSTNGKRRCNGLVSDWSKRSCGSQGRLRITMSGGSCSDVNSICGNVGVDMADTTYVSPFCSGNGKVSMHMEFSCSSYYVIDHMHAVLVTKTTGKVERYMCWGIILDSNQFLWQRSGSSNSAWKELFLMKTTLHCGSMDQFAPFNLAQARLSLRVENGVLQRPCSSLTNLNPTTDKSQQRDHKPPSRDRIRPQGFGNGPRAGFAQSGSRGVCGFRSLLNYVISIGVMGCFYGMLTN